MTKENENKFGEFRGERPLTDYELEHLNEFLAESDGGDIPANEVSLTNAINQVVSEYQDSPGELCRNEKARR